VRVFLPAGVLLAFLLPWLLPGVARAQPTRIVLVHQIATDYLPVQVAAAHGLFARHGLEVTLQPLPNGGQVPGALVSGSAQIGTLTIVLLLQAAGQGLPLVCVAGAAETAPDVLTGAALLPAGSPIGDARGFVGRTVGVSARGSFLDVLFEDWLARHGADPAAVHYAEAPFPQLPDLLRAGRIDAALLAEPFASRVLRTQPGSRMIDMVADFPAGLMINGYAAERGWARDHAAAVAAFRVALGEAIAWIGANPDAARADLAAGLHMAPEVVAGMALPHFAPVVTPKQIADWAALLRRQGLLDHAPDTAALLD
jgi:NitT/TauT family transport system substrate-binding protein